MYAIDLVAQFGEQLSRDGVACSGSVEGEDTDATAMRCRYIGDVDDWRLSS